MYCVVVLWFALGWLVGVIGFCLMFVSDCDFGFDLFVRFLLFVGISVSVAVFCWVACV